MVIPTIPPDAQQVQAPRYSPNEDATGRAEDAPDRQRLRFRRGYV